MTHVPSEWAEYHFPLYTADSIHSLYGTSNLPRHAIRESVSVLLAIAGGKGSLTMQDETYELAEGSVVLLPAHCEAVLTTVLPQPLHAYKLLIGSREHAKLHPAGAMVRKSEIAANTDVLFLPDEPAIVARVEELYIHRLPGTEARHVQNQITFHQIILQLLEHLGARLAVGERPSMERSIAYLESHYSEKVTREQLSAMAGVSRSHYSILFKQVTGFSPNEYLSRLRVNRVKELLLMGTSTLREIAQKVGYKDEFYLSRRFKQQCGTSPSCFVSKPFQRVAVMLSPYASHLLMLGIEPAVTISDSSESVMTPELQPQTMNFVDAYSPAEQVKAVLLATDVELIIAAKQDLRYIGLEPGHLRAVAPIVDIPWMEMGWKEHLRLIARVMQKNERAEQWLAAFEQEEQQARSLIQASAVAHEQVAILVVKPDELLVYGARNVGYVMYQSLGLQAPAKIAQLIHTHGDQFHSIAIQLSELDAYAASRYVVIVFPDEKGSTAHSETLFASAEWNRLPAVQQNRVHLLDRDEWVPYNPISIRLQLQRAVALFTGNQ